jgi:hypothetical protein
MALLDNKKHQKNIKNLHENIMKPEIHYELKFDSIVKWRGLNKINVLTIYNL